MDTGPRPASWAGAAWALAGFGLALLDRLLWDTVWVLAMDVWLAYLIVGVAITAWAGVRARRAKWSRRSLVDASLVPACAIALWVCSGPVSASGDDLLFRYRFASGRAEFVRVVALVRGSPGSRPRSSFQYEVDAGPPVRVAFVMPGGILDNWEGVVYDPTGAVKAARGWSGSGQFTAPPQVRSLFGGDIVWCEHIEGAFFRCQFT